MKKNKPILPLFTLFVCLVIAAPVITGTIFRFDKEFLKKAEEKCGKEAPARFTAWEDLIHNDKSPSDREKLEKVNKFFNSRILFVNDIDLWGVKDYWATPLEFLCKKAGDCEDFAIAKYFTLKAMGVAEEKLNIAYVKAIQYNIAHMVLTYYSEPGAEPLVIDNLIDSIDPASKRTDLMPIFSFNGLGLWTAKERGKGKMAGSADRLKPWQGLMQKMSENKL
ncbi:MAG: transglutaminase-like cysteine peptidase [Proteobacteria bacterium]|nr:transglutaminase-like cysteine peptidase [Pseudomonadota bacterium]MBU1398680.1 transglutaminase-like cysteine peptidase [Pseudomonadota bacterium]MBU1569420.1 transglutaminase-like cysteine peptidase [Pseudomonadota bacterium]